MADEIPEIEPVNRGVHLFMGTATALIVVFLIWANFGVLDVVSQANGEVVPSSQLKSVQHLEGGIVSEILVKEGETVARDKPLVVLRSTASGADVNELSIRLSTLRLAAARLEAESEERAEIKVPADIRANHPDLVADAEALFASRRGKIQSTIGGLQDQMSQREQAATEVEARIRNSRNSLKHLDEQVAISESMIKEGLSNRYTHLALLREQSNLRSRIDEDEAMRGRTLSAIKEAKAQIETQRQGYRQEVGEALASTRRDLDELSQRFNKLNDNLDRTVIRSPVDGVIKTLYVATQGGVVKAGATVVDIVPVDDRLIIEARLPIVDIGYVSVGQLARIKLAGQDAARFGAIDGTVIQISPDTTVTEKAGSFYKVRIETASDHFQHKAQHYRLYPGMQVSASIRTGERTVMAYILEPFLGYADTALHER
jgi:adhesin transport system membrane fusion protein